MIRRLSIWILLVGLSLGSTPAAAQEAAMDVERTAVPALPEGAALPLDTVTPRAVAERLDAAGSALRAGLPVAETLFREVLELAGSTSAQRQEARLGLADALIAAGDFASAKAVLEMAGETLKSRARWQIRMAVARLSSRQTARAAALIEEISTEHLPAALRSWYFVVRGLLYEETGMTGPAAEAFQDAREAALSQGQLAQVEALILRNQTRSGVAGEEQARRLEALLRDASRPSLRLQYALQLAIVYASLDQVSEAVAVLEDQRELLSRADPAVRDRFLITLGLLAGDMGARDVRLGALEEVVRSGENPEAMQVALNLLMRGLAEDEIETLLDSLEAIIGEVPDHPLLDKLLLRKAVLAARTGDTALAQSALGRLTQSFPASPLRPDALQLLGALAWERGELRTAAAHFQELHTLLESGARRRRAAAYVGDAYFLNRDYASAAVAYGSALSEAMEGGGVDNQFAGQLFYQQVLAHIRADNFEAAALLLDSPAADRIRERSPIRRWQAEWNLVQALRQEGLPGVETAYTRVVSLLEAAASREQVIQPALRLRLLWLRAWLSVELGEVAATPAFTDEILVLVDELPESELRERQREAIIAQTLLLKGQALLARAREGDAAVALDTLQRLRRAYPQTQPAIFSYLVEVSYYTSRGRSVDAQQVLIALADNYPDSGQAPIALYEAALNAEKRGSAGRKDALRFLETLVNRYPASPLVFYARLKQGDILRDQPGGFGAAATVYRRLLDRFPDHPERYLPQLALADSLMALGTTEPVRLKDAVAAYERLSDLPQVPVDLRAEAGYKWGFGLIRLGSREAGRAVLFRHADRLLADPEVAGQLGGSGRYWAARSLLELARFAEDNEDLEAAARYYQRVIQQGLPGKALAAANLQRLTAGPEAG